MPGIRLSQKESSLIKDWVQRRAYPHPRLARLDIVGQTGLRGIRNLSLNCDRPITVVCGPSGAGKSTLLELCALSFRTPGVALPDQVVDTFDRLFVTMPQEIPFADFSVTWTYRDNVPPPVILNGADRSISADRPARPVVFISAARLTQARRQPQTVDYFRTQPALEETTQLSRPYVARLGHILGQAYQQANWSRSTDFDLQTCTTTVTYSEFNMSLAEESLIEIFRRIYSAGTGSLVIIEDIDVGLHPTTNERLAQNLVEMCEEKSLQIILSARSFEFIDALPRQFRALIEFDGRNRYLQDAPPMRQIMQSIGSAVPPDVVIFCEDSTAKSIIQEAVSGDLRRRLKIVDVGSKTRLAQFAYAHAKSGWGHKVLVVWDGDVGDDEIRGWLRSLNLSPQEQQSLSRIRLPGMVPPERWLVDQLAEHEDGAELLADELREDVRAARAMLLRASTITEHHSIFYQLARVTQFDQVRVSQGITKAAQRLNHRPLEALANQIELVARGETVIDVGIFEEGR